MVNVEGKVLLIEPNEKDRKTMLLLIACCNYEVTAFENSVEALKVLYATNSTGLSEYDAIFLDVTEPEIGGIRSIAWWKKHHPESCIVGILPDGGDIKNLDPKKRIGLGVNILIPKPVKLSYVHDALFEGVRLFKRAKSCEKKIKWYQSPGQALDPLGSRGPSRLRLAEVDKPRGIKPFYIFTHFAR